MPHGPGKYDEACTLARVATNAQAVVLIVLNGDRGTGFSVQAHSEFSPQLLADLLEHVVHQLREDSPGAAAR